MGFLLDEICFTAVNSLRQSAAGHVVRAFADCLYFGKKLLQKSSVYLASYSNL